MVFVRTAPSHAAILMLTSVHHWYGAVRFDTPWRAHVVHLSVWLGVVVGVLLGTARLTRGRHLERWSRSRSSSSPCWRVSRRLDCTREAAEQPPQHHAQ